MTQQLSSLSLNHFLSLYQFSFLHSTLLHLLSSLGFSPNWVFTKEESVKTMASDDGYDPHHAYAHHHQAAQGHTHSRLSICSSSFTCSNDEDGDCNDGFRGNMEMDMSKLSMESFDADEELSDDEKAVPTSDSDGERDCFSLPATPPQAAKQRPSPRPEGLRERERGRGPERSCEAEEECTAVDGKCEQGREEGMG